MVCKSGIVVFGASFGVGFILTKWYVNLISSGYKGVSIVGFILTKWYVNM